MTIIQFSDEDMIKDGYELPISEEDRQEYLNNILVSPIYNGWDCYDEEIKKFDYELEKIRGDERC